MVIATYDIKDERSYLPNSLENALLERDTLKLRTRQGSSLFTWLSEAKRDAPWETYAGGGNFGDYQHGFYDVVKAQQDIGVAIAKGENTAKDMLVKTNPRMVGKRMHQAISFGQELKRFQQTDIYGALVEELQSRGRARSTIDGYFSGFLEPSALGANVEFVDRPGKNYMGVNKNFSSLIKKWAKQYDVDVGSVNEGMLAYFLAHESIHAAGVESERELEEIIESVFSKLTNKETKGFSTGTDRSEVSLRERYQNIAKIASRRGREVKENYGGDYNGRASALVAEAKDKGLEGDAVEEYVVSQLDSEGFYQDKRSEDSEEVVDSKEAAKDSSDDQDANDQESTEEESAEAA